MFCNACGAKNSDNAIACAACGHSFGPEHSAGANVPSTNPYQASRAGQFADRANVPNYLVRSILSTVCCCLPFGIVAIVYAAQVDSKLAGGDYEGAVRSSELARTWSLVSICCGLIPQLLYLGMVAFTGLAHVMRH